MKLLYPLLALGFSIFYASKAFEIFGPKNDGRPSSWVFHQWWFDFLGSLAGWAALWLVIRRVVWSADQSQTIDLKASDGLLAIVAFVGMTGHLPRLIYGLVQSVDEIAKKLMGLVDKQEEKDAENKR